jgi:uncharacterized protein (DUF58 family)
MEVSELLKKVRRIEIKARGLSDQLFSGEYHSAFKGRGMSFSEVREYQYGDDIRTIDWNVTARFGHPYVKVFEEERELTVMLILDISGSEEFGSHGPIKRDLLAEISAVIAFSAIQNNDKIGAILFADGVEKFIPPRKGKSHALRIVRDLLDFEPASKKTNIGEAIKYFNDAVKKRSTAFLISDLMDQDFENPLKIAARKHDMIVFRLIDPLEMQLPKAGLTLIQDPETGKRMWIDTADKKVRQAYESVMLKHDTHLVQYFRKSGIDAVKILTNTSYIRPISNFFKQRETRR